ncbi:MAG: cyclodeaminase/cyclohydrolase family protein [Bryobacteraceae bacterium]
MVLENRLAEAAASGLDEFLDALAAPAATPGGGSASAAAGAMAAALGAMVAALAKKEGHEFEADRKFLAEAVERDTQAFDRVMAAYRIPKAERAPHVEAALHQAATVPMEVVERAFALDQRLAALQREAPARFSSDLETARALARAALAGSLANVRINLDSITDEGFRRVFEERLGKLA